MLILSYGHVYSSLETTGIAGLALGRHRYLLVIWIILLVLIFYIADKIEQFSTFENAARLISIALIVFVVVRLITFYSLEWQAVREQTLDETGRQVFQADASNGNHPDIYYIILDAYGRSDVLANNFDIDNTEFLNSLRSMGFYIANCSQSNYAHTNLSLASSLNYNYLDNLKGDFFPGNAGWSDLNALLRNSAARRFFDEKNYRVIAFETGYAWTEWRNADLFIENKGLFLSKNFSAISLLNSACI
jgi:hypothetical protein